MRTLMMRLIDRPGRVLALSLILAAQEPQPRPKPEAPLSATAS